MAAPPDNHQAPLKYQTWALKVPIHCEGCKKKVKKILQSMDGVYMTTIDSQQHKVIVTGNVEAEALIKKLSRKGKPAQLWPDHKSEKKEKIQEPPPKEPEEPKEKSKATPNEEEFIQKPENNPIDKSQDPAQAPNEGGNDQAGQNKKKKKKNKGQNGNSPNDNNPSEVASPPPEQPNPSPECAAPPTPPASVESPPIPPPEFKAPPPAAPPAVPPMEPANLGLPNKIGPMHQQAHPYFGPGENFGSINHPGYMYMPPAHNPPPPQPGISYSMAQPSTSGSYYVPQAYSYYAYPQHRMMHIPPPPPPRHINDNYDDHDHDHYRDYNDDASQCRLM